MDLACRVIILNNVRQICKYANRLRINVRKALLFHNFKELFPDSQDDLQLLITNGVIQPCRTLSDLPGSQRSRIPPGKFLHQPKLDLCHCFLTKIKTICWQRYHAHFEQGIGQLFSGD